MKKRQRIIFGFAVLLIAALFTVAGCGDTPAGPAGTGSSGDDPDLSGTVTIIPNASVTTNTLLTTYYYGGTETIASYQWKRGDTNVGVNSNTYTPNQAGIYSVTISAKGYKSKTSSAVEVKISGDQELNGTITIGPTLNVKVDTQLSATYSGTETVSYQWKRDNTDVGTGLTTYTPDQAGLYTVTVSAAGYKNKTSAAVNVTASNGNTEAKSLYIIGITDNYIAQSDEGGYVLVFPAGTALNDAKADLSELYKESGSLQHAIAGVNFQSPVRVGATYATTGPMYAGNNIRWTGSGTVDMYALCSDGTSGHLYKVPNLLIQSAVTTVSLFDLDVVDLGEIPLPHIPGISGDITLTNIPAGFAPGRIWINCTASKEGSTVWHNESHGGNGVNYSKGSNDLPWKIKISDFVWNNSADAGRTDFFPANLYFYVHVHFDGGDNDPRNYYVTVPSPKLINSEDEAIDLGVVNLNEDKHPY